MHYKTASGIKKIANQLRMLKKVAEDDYNFWTRLFDPAHERRAIRNKAAMALRMGYVPTFGAFDSMQNKADDYLVEKGIDSARSARLPEGRELQESAKRVLPKYLSALKGTTPEAEEQVVKDAGPVGKMLRDKELSRKNRTIWMWRLPQGY